LIYKYYKTTAIKKQIVVLIDDCDKPVTDALCTEYEENNKGILTGFYSPLKDSDDYIKPRSKKINFFSEKTYFQQKIIYFLSE